MIFFVVFLLILTVLLLMPLDVIINYISPHESDGTQSKIDLHWMFGIFKWSLLDSDHKKTVVKIKKNSLFKKKADYKFYFLRNSKLKYKFLDFLSQSLNSIKISKLKLIVNFGFKSPSETGEIYGYIQALCLGLCKYELRNLQINPDFDRKIFKLNGYAKFRIYPLKILIYLFILITTSSLLKEWFHAKMA